MSEDVSRRKALALLGLGAALGFTLSAALEPSEAEAQEAAPAAAPAATAGTHGMRLSASSSAKGGHGVGWAMRLCGGRFSCAP